VILGETLVTASLGKQEPVTNERLKPRDCSTLGKKKQKKKQVTLRSHIVSGKEEFYTSGVMLGENKYE
jgi:hypothetical protein